jgi:hypothetical protein
LLTIVTDRPHSAQINSTSPSMPVSGHHRIVAALGLGWHDRPIPVVDAH